MNLEQAIDLIEQGLNAANKAGTFTLNDASLINQAIKLVKHEMESKSLTKESEPAVEEKPDKKK